ncbi:MAG: FAD-binding protein [Bacteroidetes bacterium]|nr:FAD-binding protein [Bacteroidota bacterium]
MTKEVDIRLSPEIAADETLFRKAIADHLCVAVGEICGIRKLKQSLDARKPTVWVNCRVQVYISEEPGSKIAEWPEMTNVSQKPEVVIIGAGPAGLFAALELICVGLKPVIFERGKPVAERKADIASINRGAPPDKNSNLCFGEGGAGTFSDGKLFTRSIKRGNTRRALEWLFLHGADERILYEVHPHIGSNKLPGIIAKMRETILHHGGEYHFNHCLTEIGIESGKICKVVFNGNIQCETSAIILATGHSARDIYQLLDRKGILLEAKPFALGVRIEHSQEFIDRAQYHGKPRGKYLPPASYSLAKQIDGRGVFSFCMCPGGQIVPAVTSPGEIVLNGMSNAGRTGKFANAGIVVTVDNKDFELFGEGALAGMLFQQAIEQKAAEISGNGIAAPSQRASDFIRGKISSRLPESSYFPGCVSAMIRDIFPKNICNALRSGLIQFDKQIRGFASSEALLLATESRTSSPIRIPRNPATLMHNQVTGLFPCGEGAGYSGGILSSAVDGMNTALQVAVHLKS